MSLFQTRLCFVCSHLASGHKSGDQQKRNSDVDEILRRTRFSSLFSAGQPLMIPSHDRIFWFGDLNYHIDLSDGEVGHLVAMKRWDDLLKYDQLTKELLSGSTFLGWKEGLFNFPPTYKYERNSSRYVGEIPNETGKKRSPAWSKSLSKYTVFIRTYVCISEHVQSHIMARKGYQATLVLESSRFDPLRPPPCQLSAPSSWSRLRC